ncbi:peptidoglycan recognition protein family protein, partial [Paenibacillus larvae]|uniref:peptidoglycan recognition protein family protein n=1 Tax=Paenibacillus larvae TaxID=1464 RepID=UPI0018E9D85B
MEIRKMLVDPSKYGIKCPNKMAPKYITYHNTANDAPAENEIRYMIGNNNEVSFHVAVDDKEAVQGIPFDRNAWHCGDGNRTGNRQSIGVEICYSKSGGSRYYKAEDHAAIIIAQLMKQFCIPIGNVVPHQHWSGKYCPHRMLDEGRIPSFIERIKQAYEGEEDDMNRTLQLEDWQWKQLYDNMGKAWNAGKFTDWCWMVKIENHTLTVDELAWLNNHILASSL